MTKNPHFARLRWERRLVAFNLRDCSRLTAVMGSPSKLDAKVVSQIAQTAPTVRLFGVLS
jgi:hypothetical protein